MNISDDTSTTPNLLQPNNVTSNNIWKVQLHFAFNVIYAVNAILGIPTKSFVMWFIFMDKSSKSSGVVLQFFNLNLIVSDLLFCLCGLTFTLVSIYPKMLALTLYMLALPFTSRPLFLCLICMERYLAVVHPVTFLKFKPLRYRLMCSAAVWVITLASGAFYLSVLLSNNVHLFVCTLLPSYFLLLSFKIFCCLAIFRTLKHPGPGQKGKDRERANHVKRKAINVILITIVGVLIQYIPLFTAGFLYDVLSEPHFYISWCTALCMSFLSGYIYILPYFHRIRYKVTCLRHFKIKS